MTKQLFALYETPVLTRREKCLFALLPVVGFVWAFAIVAMIGEVGRDSELFMTRPMILWEARMFYFAEIAWEGTGFTGVALLITAWILKRINTGHAPPAEDAVGQR